MKICYVPSLGIGTIYWRIHNYANCIVDTLMPEHSVYVEHFFDPRDRCGWENAALDYGEISQDIQYKLNAMFNHFDIIIFQKIQNKAGIFLLEEFKKKYPKVKVLLEMDDSVGDITPSNIFELKEECMWGAYHAQISHGIICSTAYLAKSVADLNPNAYVAPNCINPSTWNPGDLYVRDITAIQKRIGYVGAAAHDEDLLIAYPAILKLLKDDPNLTFVIRYGGYKPDWLQKHPQIDFKQVGWALDDYPKKMNELKLDVAIAPLRDSEFNRCKSNLKWIEWSSLGVTLVASKVEPYLSNPSIVKEPYIYLSENDDLSWKKAIKKGLESPIPNLEKACYSLYNIQEETIKLIEFLKTL